MAANKLSQPWRKKMLKIQGQQVQGLNAAAIAALKSEMNDVADANGDVCLVEISSKESRRVKAGTDVDFNRFLPIKTYRELTGYAGSIR